MVVDGEKWIVKDCRQQVGTVLVALAHLEPSTPKGKKALSRATHDLKDARAQLDTLYRHYCHIRHRKPPPKEVPGDLP